MIKYPHHHHDYGLLCLPHIWPWQSLRAWDPWAGWGTPAPRLAPPSSSSWHSSKMEARRGCRLAWDHQGAVRNCEDPAPGSWQLFPHLALPCSHFWGARLERQGESGRLSHLGQLLPISQDPYIHDWSCSYRIEVSTLCPNCPPMSLLFSSSLDPAADPLSDGDVLAPRRAGPRILNPLPSPARESWPSGSGLRSSHLVGLPQLHLPLLTVARRGGIPRKHWAHLELSPHLPFLCPCQHIPHPLPRPF